MREILERLLGGEFTVEEALRALQAANVEVLGELARLDPGRLRRKGVPEVVYAPGKSPEVTAQLARQMLEATGQALVSRVSPAHDAVLRDIDGEMVEYGTARRLLRRPAEAINGDGGVGILAAGTSDIDVAEEARMMVDAMGLPCLRAYDVGASALHRLHAPLQAMIGAGVDAIVVAAGMEAALPTVVAGLVSTPVVALPVSSGYGAGGNGLAALLASLQTCSPGMTVVNIDNGIGAGAAAGLIAARVAAARLAPTPARGARPPAPSARS
jgi:NCAIR mutase (PurE)-related protein